jgi:hypothetical protein
LRAVAALLALGVATFQACAKEVIGPEVPISVALDSLPFPAVVVGDSLRDTSGTVAAVQARAFNFRGELLESTAFRYLIVDRGASIDSTTGIVVGDSVRATPVRIVARLNGLQTNPIQLAVVPRPDSLAAVTTTDTLRYSLTDSTVNVSNELSVRVLHDSNPPVPVASWVVRFRITVPTDTLLAFMVNGGSSPVDTTSIDGTAARRVRIRAQRLSMTSDSVIVLASATYRGAHLRGSPQRLVVHLRPLSQ